MLKPYIKAFLVFIIIGCVEIIQWQEMLPTPISDLKPPCPPPLYHSSDFHRKANELTVFLPHFYGSLLTTRVKKNLFRAHDLLIRAHDLLIHSLKLANSFPQIS